MIQGQLPIASMAKSNETIAFEIACINQLDVKKEEKVKSAEEMLKAHQPEYAELTLSF